MKKSTSKHNNKSSKTAKQNINILSGERIQKLLAHAGIGSRREIERWIEEGKLRINNHKVSLGDRLRTGDNLQINGSIVRWEKFGKQATRMLIYNKPMGELVTRRDLQGRPVIFTQLPKLSVGRWIAVGRLDINTQGLLLVTNNGELANRLMHPSTKVEREYAVRVFGEVSTTMLDRMQAGVELEDGWVKFDRIKFSGGEGINKWYHVTVTEGRNRLVRRLWASQGLAVNRLMRIRYGAIHLPERLKTRTFYELIDKELKIIMQSVNLASSFT